MVIIGLLTNLPHQHGSQNIMFTISQYYSNHIVWKYMYKTHENHVFDYTGPLRIPDLGSNTCMFKYLYLNTYVYLFFQIMWLNQLLLFEVFSNKFP